MRKRKMITIEELWYQMLADELDEEARDIAITALLEFTIEMIDLNSTNKAIALISEHALIRSIAEIQRISKV
jgi:hypothetical protein